MENAIPKTIEAFLHCAACIREGIAYKRKIEVGVTPDGDIQAWCVIHNRNIACLPLDPEWFKDQTFACHFCQSGQPHSHTH